MRRLREISWARCPCHSANFDAVSAAWRRGLVAIKHGTVQDQNFLHESVDREVCNRVAPSIASHFPAQRFLTEEREHPLHKIVMIAPLN